jgi:hypothetical protein
MACNSAWETVKGLLGLPTGSGQTPPDDVAKSWFEALPIVDYAWLLQTCAKMVNQMSPSGVVPPDRKVAESLPLESPLRLLGLTERHSDYFPKGERLGRNVKFAYGRVTMQENGQENVESVLSYPTAMRQLRHLLPPDEWQALVKDEADTTNFNPVTEAWARATDALVYLLEGVPYGVGSELTGGVSLPDAIKKIEAYNPRKRRKVMVLGEHMGYIAPKKVTNRTEALATGFLQLETAGVEHETIIVPVHGYWSARASCWEIAA